MAAGSRSKSIAAWILCALLAALFLFAGSGKVAGSEDMVKAFDSFGYPQWFRVVIGSSELAGAVGLLVPTLAQHAAAGLMIIMAGAVWTHIGVGQPFAMPLIVLLLLSVVVWLRRPSS